MCDTHLPACRGDIRRHQSHKSYRPLTVLSFKLNNYVSGMDPRAFRATNVILHGAVCFLFTLFATEVFAGQLFPILFSA